MHYFISFLCVVSRQTDSISIESETEGLLSMAEISRCFSQQ